MPLNMGVGYSPYLIKFTFLIYNEYYITLSLTINDHQPILPRFDRVFGIRTNTKSVDLTNGFPPLGDVKRKQHETTANAHVFQPSCLYD